MIKGYDIRANITLLNVIYNRPKKDLETGKYDTGSLDIIFKDLDTNEKKIQHIRDPDYIYYMAKPEYAPQTNLFYIEKDKVDPIKCKYRELKKDIATRTNNLEFFYDNLKNGNARQNEKLFTIGNFQRIWSPCWFKDGTNLWIIINATNDTTTGGEPSGWNVYLIPFNYSNDTLEETNMKKLGGIADNTIDCHLYKFIDKYR